MEFVKNYFNAERTESIFFVCFGLIALIVALFFILFNKSSFQKGMSIPLIAVAFIQITVGTIVWIRSPKDVKRMEHVLQKETTKVNTEELPRMELVMRNFVIYRYVEIGLLALALLLMLLMKQKAFLYGVGTGLFIQATLMLSLDFFAEKRAAVYIQQLHELNKEVN